MRGISKSKWGMEELMEGFSTNDEDDRNRGGEAHDETPGWRVKRENALGYTRVWFTCIA